MKVLIAIPTYDDKLGIHTVMSLMGLAKPCECEIGIISRLRTDRARNNFAQDAIDRGMDGLFFMDDDNPVPQDALKRFIASGKDVIGALIPGRAKPFSKCVYELKDVDGIPSYYPLKDTPKDVFKCDAVGTGCMFIKTDVLKAVKAKYGTMFEVWTEFYEREKEDGTKETRRRNLSEDLEFCRRAADCGFDIYCDPNVRPWHEGSSRHWQVQEDGSVKDIGAIE